MRVRREEDLPEKGPKEEKRRTHKEEVPLVEEASVHQGADKSP